MNKEILERANKIYKELEQTEKIFKILVDTPPSSLVNFVSNYHSSINIETRETMKNMLYTYFTEKITVLRKEFEEVDSE